MAIKNRRLWFKVHGWLSLPIWLLFSFICLTGTIAVFSHEITWLVNPDARAENVNEVAAKPLHELVAAVEDKVPGADVQGVMVLEPYLVTAIRFTSPKHPVALAYVNPYTAEVQEINSGFTFIEFMRALHSWLLFPWQAGYSIGYYLVSLMSLVTLGALITGLVVYKRFWKSYTRPQLRTHKGSRTLLGDFHRLAGAWSLWFLLVMGVTGFWYLTQAIMWHNGVEFEQHPEPIATEQLPFSNDPTFKSQTVTLEQAIAKASLAMPGFEPAYIVMPEHNRAYYDIKGKGDSVFYDQYSYQAYINPWSGEIAQVTTPESMKAVETLAHIADPLHYGTLGGIWTKIIWFLFGVLLSAMSITGFVIYGKRTLKSDSSNKRKNAQVDSDVFFDEGDR